MADLQLEGVAAIYNILCKHGFAYLADEVGMGKTYQALGLVALLWNEKPDARVLFISPRQNLQVKWHGDYIRFFASNYRRVQGLGDDRVASVLFGEPLHRPVLFHNLRSWTPTIGMSERIAPFVRHTSFTRPVYLTSKDLGDMNELWEKINRRLRSWGLFGVERPRGLSEDNASELFNLEFAGAANARLTDETGKGAYFDLVIVDEAQCLRNPDNQTNRVLFETLRGHVRKWLFLSATPAHGGPEDLRESSTTIRTAVRFSIRISFMICRPCRSTCKPSLCGDSAAIGQAAPPRWCERASIAIMTPRAGAFETMG